MLVTLLPIVMLIRPLQALNASVPMLVTLLGIVALVSPLQPKNASFPMLVTLLGIIVLLQPLIIVFVDVFTIALQLSRLSYTLLPLSTTMLIRPLQALNASVPMLVTLLGIVMLVRPLQA